MHIRGAYANVRIAMPNSIHSNPMVFTRVPLIAGPLNTAQTVIHGYSFSLFFIH